MRVLSLSNFYPPHAVGGYELWCQEVSEGLQARGHDVTVLTSRFRADERQEDGPVRVERTLRLEMELGSRANAVRFFTSRRAAERENLDRLTALVQETEPDCVLVWGMWNLHRSVPALAERLRPDRTAYYVGDYWPSLPSQFVPYWESRGRSRIAAAAKAPVRLVARRMLARERQPALEFRRAMFPTAFVRDELARRGVRAGDSRVVCGAIDTRAYAARADVSRPVEPGALRLLCASRLTPDKGVHTAIEALAVLAHRHGLTGAHLAIVGSGDAAYESRLRALAGERGVASRVSFLGARSKEDMPQVYREADVFLFTSLWPEPFGRVIVEAMASQLAVVGTVTGGAAEILIDRRNALTVEPGDVEGLADRVARLAGSPGLREQLGRQGREDAVARFDIRRMTDEIEQTLRQIVGEHGRDRTA